MREMLFAFASGCASQRRGCSRKTGLQMECPFSSPLSAGIGKCLASLLLTCQKTQGSLCKHLKRAGLGLLGNRAAAEQTANVNWYLYYWSISTSKQVGKGANLSNHSNLGMQGGRLGKHPCELPKASCLCPFSHPALQKKSGCGTTCLPFYSSVSKCFLMELLWHQFGVCN